MNITRHRLTLLAWPLLLIILLCGCTAKTAEADESGLPPHLTVHLQLPEHIQSNTPTVFSVAVSKGGEPLKSADKAEFVIWKEGHKESAMIMNAVESSPGVYSITKQISEEGLYVVQSRISSADGQVMPAKRFAIGASAVEQLAVLEEAQKSGVSAPAENGHHH